MEEFTKTGEEKMMREKMIRSFSITFLVVALMAGCSKRTDNYKNQKFLEEVDEKEVKAPVAPNITTFVPTKPKGGESDDVLEVLDIELQEKRIKTNSQAPLILNYGAANVGFDTSMPASLDILSRPTYVGKGEDAYRWSYDEGIFVEWGATNGLIQFFSIDETYAGSIEVPGFGELKIGDSLPEVTRNPELQAEYVKAIYKRYIDSSDDNCFETQTYAKCSIMTAEQTGGDNGWKISNEIFNNNGTIYIFFDEDFDTITRVYMSSPAPENPSHLSFLPRPSAEVQLSRINKNIVAPIVPGVSAANISFDNSIEDGLTILSRPNYLGSEDSPYNWSYSEGVFLSWNSDVEQGRKLQFININDEHKGSIVVPGLEPLTVGGDYAAINLNKPLQTAYLNKLYETYVDPTVANCVELKACYPYEKNDEKDPSNNMRIWVLGQEDYGVIGSVYIYFDNDWNKLNRIFMTTPTPAFSKKALENTKKPILLAQGAAGVTFEMTQGEAMSVLDEEVNADQANNAYTYGERISVNYGVNAAEGNKPQRISIMKGYKGTISIPGLGEISIGQDLTYFMANDKAVGEALVALTEATAALETSVAYWLEEAAAAAAAAAEVVAEEVVAEEVVAEEVVAEEVVAQSAVVVAFTAANTALQAATDLGFEAEEAAVTKAKNAAMVAMENAFEATMKAVYNNLYNKADDFDCSEKQADSEMAACFWNDNTKAIYVFAKGDVVTSGYFLSDDKTSIKEIALMTETPESIVEAPVEEPTPVVETPVDETPAGETPAYAMQPIVLGASAAGMDWNTTRAQAGQFLVEVQANPGYTIYAGGVVIEWIDATPSSKIKLIYLNADYKGQLTLPGFPAITVGSAIDAQAVVPFVVAAYIAVTPGTPADYNCAQEQTCTLGENEDGTKTIYIGQLVQFTMNAEMTQLLGIMMVNPSTVEGANTTDETPVDETPAEVPAYAQAPIVPGVSAGGVNWNMTKTQASQFLQELPSSAGYSVYAGGLIIGWENDLPSFMYIQGDYAGTLNVPGYAPISIGAAVSTILDDSDTALELFSNALYRMIDPSVATDYDCVASQVCTLAQASNGYYELYIGTQFRLDFSPDFTVLAGIMMSAPEAGTAAPIEEQPVAVTVPDYAKSPILLGTGVAGITFDTTEAEATMLEQLPADIENPAIKLYAGGFMIMWGANTKPDAILVMGGEGGYEGAINVPGFGPLTFGQSISETLLGGAATPEAVNAFANALYVATKGPQAEGFDCFTAQACGFVNDDAGNLVFVIGTDQKVQITFTPNGDVMTQILMFSPNVELNK